MKRKAGVSVSGQVSKFILGVFLGLSVTGAYSTRDNMGIYILKAGDSISAAFFSAGLQVKDLVSKYDRSDETGERITILIVPGHEPDFGGAIYQNLKERDMNLALAQKMKVLLEANSKFEVIMSRDANGWNPELANFVYTNNKELDAWVKGMKQEMSRLVEKGLVTRVREKVGHVNAPTSSVLFLYGINKWASDNKVDIALHIHFNDNIRRAGAPAYEGFSIYVPERQYSNSVSSKVLAKDLWDELIKVQKVSTLPQESEGMIEDQELIAIGSFNTSDSLSILIEYGYIYEKKLQYGITRNFYMNDVASSSARAIENFFESRLVENI